MWFPLARKVWFENKKFSGFPVSRNCQEALVLVSPGSDSKRGFPPSPGWGSRRELYDPLFFEERHSYLLRRRNWRSP